MSDNPGNSERACAYIDGFGIRHVIDGADFAPGEAEDAPIRIMNMDAAAVAKFLDYGTPAFEEVVK